MAAGQSCFRGFVPVDPAQVMMQRLLLPRRILRGKAGTRVDDLARYYGGDLSCQCGDISDYSPPATRLGSRPGNSLRCLDFCADSSFHVRVCARAPSLRCFESVLEVWEGSSPLCKTEWPLRRPELLKNILLTGHPRMTRCSITAYLVTSRRIRLPPHELSVIHMFDVGDGSEIGWQGRTPAWWTNFRIFLLML